MPALRWMKLVLVLLTLALTAACGDGGDADRRNPFIDPPPPTPQAPVIQPIASRSVVSGETVTFIVQASSPDGAALTLSPVDLPSGASFNTDNGLFAWIPGPENIGLHVVTFTAVDSRGLQSSTTVQITVVPSDTEPEPATGITTFGQTIPADDQDLEVFPGQANVWDIDADFALLDGGDFQFEYAMALAVGPIGRRTAFPIDQSYQELTWGGPLLGPEDGVVVAAVADGSFVDPIDGNYSAYLNGTSDSRLMQDVDLTGVPEGTPLTLSWSQISALLSGYFEGAPSYFRLVVRDAEGAELLRRPLDVGPVEDSLDVTALAGRVIQISFEAQFVTFQWVFDTTPSVSLSGLVQIDNVTLRDDQENDFIVNGDFETGDLTGWDTNVPQESQNITSGTRTLSTDSVSVNVTRSFFTVPNNLWGRWVDVFENPGPAEIAVPLRYTVFLGANLNEQRPDGSYIGTAVIYDPETGGRALTAWDARELLGFVGSRDVGLVFGTLEADQISLTDLATVDGDPEIYLEDVLLIPPGGRLAVVNFVVMNGTDTGEGAADLAARATQIDEENRRIVQNFWTDPQYLQGIPQDIQDVIVNFPRP